MIPPDSADYPDRDRVCAAVEGYLTLDLPDLAAAELDTLSPADREHPSALMALMAVEMNRKRWEAAVDTGLRGCRNAPRRGAFFFHTAYCLHELGRTDAARKLLESAPQKMRGDPLYHYNLGCYLTVLGEGKDAETSLRRAFSMDPKLRDYARRDPDLRTLWPVL